MKKIITQEQIDVIAKWLLYGTMPSGEVQKICSMLRNLPSVEEPKKEEVK